MKGPTDSDSTIYTHQLMTIRNRWEEQVDRFTLVKPGKAKLKTLHKIQGTTKIRQEVKKKPKTTKTKTLNLAHRLGNKQTRIKQRIT